VFREVLARTGHDLPGCKGAALVGLDGMVIEQWTLEDTSSMESVAAELSSLLKAARGATRNTEGGPLAEVTLRTEAWAGVIRSVGAGYYLMVLTAPDALLGRTRFFVERAIPLLEKEVA
jgi:predicted regulator of Ras-like GTPase activity (Roadblock/LC7/MglB family)